MKMFSPTIDNILCIFCKNSTILSTERSQYCDINTSEDETKYETGLYSICVTCNKFSYITENTLIYNEVIIKASNKILDIKYNPKLVSFDVHCSNCKTDTTYKMFSDNNNDLNYKYICVNCDKIFTKID